MAIDTITPRSRRAVLMGALGALAASVTTIVKPAPALAGTDGDVALDATNAASGTTTITSSVQAPILQLISSGDVGIIGSSGAAAVDLPDPIAASTGVYGLSVAGHGVSGASDTGHEVYAANNSATKAAIAAEGAPGTAIHGHAGFGPIPDSPAHTGIFGSAAGTDVAIAAASATGLAVLAQSSAGAAVFGEGGDRCRARLRRTRR